MEPSDARALPAPPGSHGNPLPPMEIQPELRRSKKKKRKKPKSVGNGEPATSMYDGEESQDDEKAEEE